MRKIDKRWSITSPRCERLSPQEYYVTPQANGSNGGPDSKLAVDGMRDGGMTTLSWPSPIKTAFAANNIARADLFRTNARNWTEAPTVFLLHALMSSSPTGYYRWAEKFNELGWNACFVHLPYHFSRSPTGHWNGELAITPDLIRNAEGLRQGVIEVRQIMESLRGLGCREFGVLATSYGGWIGALLTLVESDFRFVALMSPIVNVEHAIWQSPAARRLRRELRPGKRRARSGCAPFSLEFAFTRAAGVRSNADSIRHRGLRFDCSTRGNRGNSPNMAGLETVTRATRTFRSSHDAGNNRAPEPTRRSGNSELINTWL